MRLGCRFLLLICVCSLLFLPPHARALRAQTVSQPANWNDAVQALAEKIAGLAGKTRLVSLDLKNNSSLSAEDVAAIRAAIEAELTRRRFHLVTDSSAETHVVVTLSEGVAGYVWVAEVRSGDEEHVAMVTMAKPGNTGSGPLPVIVRNIVWEQPAPFVDFYQHNSGAGSPVTTVVLQRDGVATNVELGHRSVGETGTQSFSNFSNSTTIFSPTRDLRGEFLDQSGQTNRAMLGGKLCVGDGGWFCGQPPDGLWPFANGLGAHYEASRNYFTGLSLGAGMPETEQAPFYAIAFRQLDHGEWWITTELDGKARLYETPGTAAATFSGWGDDIATIETGCDNEWQVLATGTGDWTQPDQIQIYEIRDRAAVKIGQPLDFPGPILALWSSADLKSARVVSRNLQTGLYEASTVSVSCSE